MTTAHGCWSLQPGLVLLGHIPCCPHPPQPFGLSRFVVHLFLGNCSVWALERLVSTMQPDKGGVCWPVYFKQLVSYRREFVQLLALVWRGSANATVAPVLTDATLPVSGAGHGAGCEGSAPGPSLHPCAGSDPLPVLLLEEKNLSLSCAWMRSEWWQLCSQYPVINGIKLVPLVRFFYFASGFLKTF